MLSCFWVSPKVLDVFANNHIKSIPFFYALIRNQLNENKFAFLERRFVFSLGIEYRGR